jgi:hypothetical protein
MTGFCFLLHDLFRLAGGCWLHYTAAAQQTVVRTITGQRGLICKIDAGIVGTAASMVVVTMVR